MQFKIGMVAPFKTKKGVYRFVKLQTPAQVAHAQRDFDNLKVSIQNHMSNIVTNAHPVLPETKKRNANQKTCNKISKLINKMNLRF